MSEVRRVLLANGQYIEIVQETGASTGAVMSQNAVTTALNSKANTTHTHAASDITSGTFGSARITDGNITTAKLADSAVTSAKVADGAITRAKLASDVPISVTQYETVTVTGVCSDGSSIAGKQLSIGGSLYEFDSNGVVSANIPYGQAYTIRPITNNLYFSNDFYAFTAATANRSVAVSYTVGSGVYIEDKQGMLYTTADWSSGNNANANSVVVLSYMHSFRIALTQAPGQMVMGYSSHPFKIYLLPKKSMDIALLDYSGAVNTQLIVEKCQLSTSYAAGWCNAYTFPDGSKGYLPSLGELNLAYQNKDAINAALTKCGGTTLSTDDNHWSSTFYDMSSGDYYFWYIDLHDSTYGRMTSNGSNYVRAFGAH